MINDKEVYQCIMTLNKKKWPLFVMHQMKAVVFAYSYTKSRHDDKKDVKSRFFLQSKSNRIISENLSLKKKSIDQMSLLRSSYLFRFCTFKTRNSVIVKDELPKCLWWNSNNRALIWIKLPSRHFCAKMILSLIGDRISKSIN